MKIVDVDQGSPAWLQARIGVLTASNMDKVITPKTGKPSASMTPLSYRMLAEEVLGRPLDDAASGFMERGRELEGEARAWYEFEHNCEVQQVGLVLRDDGKVGCSPDGLVGDDGGVEIKCPAAHTHMGYLLGAIPDEYYCQIQGSLWMTGRTWWDFVSYNPEMPPVCLRYQRDEEFIAKLAAAAETLLATLDTHRKTLRELGALPALADAVVPVAEAA